MIGYKTKVVFECQKVVLLLALLFLWGCTDQVLVPTEPFKTQSIRDYFWKPDSILSYNLDSAGGEIHQFMVLRNGENIYLQDLTNGAPHVMDVALSEEEIAITNIDPTNTLFPLPTGTFFSDRDSITTKSEAFPAYAVFYSSMYQRLYAGTSQGLYYQAKMGEPWTLVAGTSGHGITQIAQNGSIVYALSNDGIIFRSSDGGAVWLTNVPGVTAIGFAPFDSTIVYIGMEDGSIRDLNTQGLIDPQYDSIYSPIVGLAVGTWAGRRTILVASKNNGLWFVDTDFVAKRVNGQPNVFAFHQIGLARYLASTSGDLLWDITLSGPTYKLDAITGTLPFSSLSNRDSVEVYGTTSTGTFVRLSRAGSGYAPTYSQQEIASGRFVQSITVDGNNNIVVATDSGLYASTDKGETWLGITSPSSIKEERVLGKFILLKKQNGDLQVGDSWNAGTLAAASIDGFVPITAKVVEHLDSLSIKVRTSSATHFPVYHDAFIVEYAPEDSTLRDIATWLIYFVKNQGPVLIQQSIQGKYQEAVLRR